MWYGIARNCTLVWRTARAQSCAALRTSANFLNFMFYTNKSCWVSIIGFFDPRNRFLGLVFHINHVFNDLCHQNGYLWQKIDINLNISSTRLNII